MSTVIKIENLSKRYRLGSVGTNTLHGDVKHWWAKLRGREEELYKIGEENELTDASGEYVWALRDINLEVQQGEVLGVIGKNGAGKSTLLKILSRVTGPTKGNIKIKGRIASLLEVGTGFHGELTGRENVYLNGAVLGMRRSEINRKFDEIVEFAGVAKYIDTPVKRYSSGMYVRLAFAVAAHLEPEILIVDEVLAVGDAEFQKKAVGKMQDVSANQGRTVLFVSHNMATIQTLCNRTCVMKQGKVNFYGETDDALIEYSKESKQQMNLAFSERYDRKGNQSVKLNFVQFLHAETKESLDTIMSGMPIMIRFNYSRDLDTEIKDIRFAIAFRHNTQGERFSCDNNYVKQTIHPIKEHGDVYCLIKKWPLNKGVYNFRTHIEVNKQLADRIENAGEIQVESGDFYNTGTIVMPHLNGVLVEHEWII